MLPMIQPEPTLNCGGQTVNGPSTPSACLPPSLTPESDVDDIVVSFFDIDVAIQRIESCDLQPGDTWRGMQSKMSVTAPVKKIRKKSDHKPQSQINKCHNEKRRRELENETINQLEELLGTCLAEVKQPDKNGIVREATKQIQEILNRRRECPQECPTRSPCEPPLSPVQGGEVTSTQPHASVHYSELTTLIEALKHYTNFLGWILLEINCKGEIICVTENIKDLVNLEKNELYKKSIFSLLHANDHSKIRPLLRSVQQFGWSADSEGLQAVHAKLLLKTNNVPDSAGYVEALIHCAPVRGSGTEGGGSVMCVIRRCEDASAPLVPARVRPPHVPDHITFRLDTAFTILSCDLSGVENCIDVPSSFVGKSYLDFVESADRHIALSHLRQVACYPVPPAISQPFRLCITADKPWLRVSARSRLFNARQTIGEPNFIMATHNVVNEEELLEPSAVHSPSVGGPLMTSVANGEPSTGGGDRYRSPISPGDSQFSMNDFDLEWPSQFALGEPMSEEPRERRDSTSDGPLTPRTPQTPQSEPPPPPQEEPNRLRSLLSKKPSGILTGLLQQPDEEEATSSETSAPHTPHTPASAMSPLQRAPPPPGAPSTHSHHPSTMHQPHDTNSQMLLRILNEKSDEDVEENRRSSQDGRTSQPSALLTQLLSSNGPSSNGRSQEVSDSYLERLGVKRKLPEIPASAKRATPETQQVSSSAAPAASSSSTTTSSPASSSAGMSPLCQKNQILVSLLARQQQTPLPPSSNPIQRAFGPRARPHQLMPHQHPQGMMQHQPRQHQQNMMQQHHPRASNVNGGPGLPGVSQASVECSTANTTSYPSHAATQSHLQMVLQSGGRASYQPPAPQHHQPLHYATTAPHHIYTNQQQSGGTRAAQSGGGDLPGDQTLSDILDAVIENMPDGDRSSSDVMMIGMEGNRQMRPDYDAGMKEENAVINAIRQSLMQCEKQTKSPVPSSPGPGPPPVYSVQSPGTCNIGGSLYTLGNASAATTSASTSAGVGGGGARGEAADNARARALGEQHRARLLQMQSSQQMLVSPEAADTPQSDLGSTISALVSATPPNVRLTRTDYHNLYHHPGPTNQIGSNYGTNKITSSQQNPMLSRQLSTGGSGGSTGYAHSGAGSPAALHTPMSHAPPPSHPPHSPYHRAPRPMLVGGYYDDGGYIGGEYRRAPPPPHPAAHHPAHPAVAPHTPHHEAPPPPPPPPSHLNCTGNGGGGGGGATSEFVRNELRAVVGARSSRPDLQQMQPDLDPLMHFDMPTPGGEVAARAQSTWPPDQHASTTEAGSAAGAGAAAGGDETQAAAGAGATGGGAPGAAAKASLLQKLLSQ